MPNISSFRYKMNFNPETHTHIQLNVTSQPEVCNKTFKIKHLNYNIQIKQCSTAVENNKICVNV